MNVVLIGSPGDRRVALFQAALRRLALPPARVVSYVDLIAGHAALPERVTAGAVVRIESPGEAFDATRAILAAGASAAEAEGSPHLPRAAAEQLAFDKGRIWYPRQWYLGYRATLQKIARQLAACPPHRLMNTPEDIAAMFDKPAAHVRMQRHGVPVPQALGPVQDYGELRAQMRASGFHRVFIKPAHGSSASGVVAYQTDGQRHHAVTTVEMVRAAGELHLYNSLRLRTYRQERDIAALVDALAPHRVHVERWLPKAGMDGKCFDLRVVVIGGEAQHAVARMSRSPLTNLHLANARGNIEAVRARMPPGAWESACQTCERAAACFPASLYAGVDMLIAPGFRRHAVLEINAFGDLLPRLLHNGRDTYAAEMLAVRA